jgi:hypothetical protein
LRGTLSKEQKHLQADSYEINVDDRIDRLKKPTMSLGVAKAVYAAVKLHNLGEF